MKTVKLLSYFLMSIGALIVAGFGVLLFARLVMALRLMAGGL